MTDDFCAGVQVLDDSAELYRVCFIMPGERQGARQAVYMFHEHGLGRERYRNLGMLE